MQAISRGGGHEYVPFAGQSAGLIRDVRPAAEIVRDTVAQAEAILASTMDTSVAVGTTRAR